MSYEFVIEKDETLKHVGGNIRHGDPATHCPMIWMWMVDRFGVRSMMDLGSGEGHCALFVSRMHNIPVIAVDASPRNVGRAKYPTILIDIEDQPALSRVDLVWCSEFVEHVDEKHINNLMNSFYSAPVIIMSHATKGQDGYNHVNCQPESYWIERFRAMDYYMAEHDTKTLRDKATQDGAHHMARTGKVFIRRSEPGSR